MNQARKIFKSGREICLISFFAFGNYFALFGLPNANKAERLMLEGKSDDANHEASKAKRWAWWGLVPSTIINIAIVWYVCLWILDIMRPLMKSIAL